LAVVGITDFIPFETANKPVGTKTRREWRIKQETGELRGVSIRERNKDRKPVGWIDRKSPGWESILASYEGWRRTARYAVGTIQQRANVPSGQPTGENLG
jgi:hypothetical protein